MGLATIAPHSQKEHTEIHKIPKFGANQASFDLRYSDLKKSKLTKKCMASGRCVGQRPDDHTLTFSNGCILLTFGSIYTKLGDFVKLGLHFMTMWLNSC